MTNSNSKEEFGRSPLWQLVPSYLIDQANKRANEINRQKDDSLQLLSQVTAKPNQVYRVFAGLCSSTTLSAANDLQSLCQAFAQLALGMSSIANLRMLQQAGINTGLLLECLRETSGNPDIEYGRASGDQLADALIAYRKPRR